MVKFLIVVFLLVQTTPSFAILDQTGDDLEQLVDQLRYQLEKESGLQKKMLPMLVATPKHYWKESRSDFGGATLKTLKEVFPETGSLINCSECDTNRLYALNDQSLIVSNGELSLPELARFRSDKRYENAKSLAMIAETPSGVKTKIIDLSSGEILFYALADSSRSLDDIQPWMNYSQELERRRRQESLYYVFVNFGLYPTGLFQMEFVEQWGAYNQHISGLGFSLLSPIAALGFVYHYMFPSMRKFHVSGSLLYPLQNIAVDIDKSRKNTGGLVVQAMAQYTFSSTLGVFASVNTDSALSLGFNFYNPIFMPFIF